MEVEKYYYVLNEPHPTNARRQQRSLVPYLVVTDPGGVRTSCSCRLMWFPLRESPHQWKFDHLTITSRSLTILTDAPELIAAIIALTEETQPHDFELRLQQLGFSRK